MLRTRPLVLVADDDADILALVRLRLSRGGYETIAATDGGQALELARTQRPDLAVLDVAMPVLTGYEVAERLRADPATHDLPIILLTARARPADVEEGFGCGADDYVTKPFSPELLQGRVEAALKAAAGRLAQRRLDDGLRPAASG